LPVFSLEGLPAGWIYWTFYFPSLFGFPILFTSPVFKTEKFSQIVMKHCSLGLLKPRTSMDLFQHGCKATLVCISQARDVTPTVLGFCEKNRNSAPYAFLSPSPSPPPSLHDLLLCVTVSSLLVSEEISQCFTEQCSLVLGHSFNKY
jgi:hypothetical protein